MFVIVMASNHAEKCRYDGFPSPELHVLCKMTTAERARLLSAHAERGNSVIHQHRLTDSIRSITDSFEIICSLNWYEWLRCVHANDSERKTKSTDDWLEMHCIWDVDLSTSAFTQRWCSSKSNVKYETHWAILLANFWCVLFFLLLLL